MAESSNRRPELYPETWPFPVNRWAIPLFWLVVLVLAALTWVFS